jgi:hypothetical protein
MEYLAIFSVAIVMTFPLIIIYSAQTQNVRADITNAEIQKVASTILDSAEEVYFMGEPAQKTITIDFPEGITGVSINENNLVFNVSTAELDYEVKKETIANLTGEIRKFTGPHIISFYAQGNLVNITDK